MRQITKEQLTEILEKHRAWLRNKDGGERADLSRADLSRSDLRYADLSRADLNDSDLRGTDLRGTDLRDVTMWGATGNMGEIKSVFLDSYEITYTAEYLQIGCECHAIADWWSFDDKRISSMDTNALSWWVIWKPVLQQLIALSPATPTGHESKQEAA